MKMIILILHILSKSGVITNSLIFYLLCSNKQKRWKRFCARFTPFSRGKKKILPNLTSIYSFMPMMTTSISCCSRKWHLLAMISRIMKMPCLTPLTTEKGLSFSMRGALRRGWTPMSFLDTYKKQKFQGRQFYTTPQLLLTEKEILSWTPEKLTFTLRMSSGQKRVTASRQLKLSTPKVKS